MRPNSNIGSAGNFPHYKRRQQQRYAANGTKQINIMARAVRQSPAHAWPNTRDNLIVSPRIPRPLSAPHDRQMGERIAECPGVLRTRAHFWAAYWCDPTPKRPSLRTPRTRSWQSTQPGRVLFGQPNHQGVDVHVRNHVAVHQEPPLVLAREVHPARPIIHPPLPVQLGATTVEHPV